MTITINGEQARVDDGISVSALLTLRKVKMPEMVSVELNGEVLDRLVFDTITIKEGDRVEFIYFMAGGAAR